MDETQAPGEKLPKEPGGNIPETGAGESSLKQIRTFQGDVANALQNQKESLFSIQKTEQLKRSAGGFVEEPAASGGGGKTLMLVLGSLVLVFLGLGGVWLGYGEYIERSSPPVIIAPQNRFIAVQDELEINFASTTEETLVAMIGEKSSEVPEGSITHLVMRQGSWAGAPLATTAEFLNRLNTEAPSTLVRALDPLFMIGAYRAPGSNAGESRFVIFKLISFDNAFPGMLAWEKTLPRDIGGIFANSEELKTIEVEPVFKDVISRNKDVRVLSGSGTTTEPVLLYSFFNNKMLIITDSLETLRILMDRLTQELLSR